MIRIYLLLAKSSNDSRALRHNIYTASKKNVHGKFGIFNFCDFGFFFVCVSLDPRYPRSSILETQISSRSLKESFNGNSEKISD